MSNFSFANDPMSSASVIKLLIFGRTSVVAYLLGIILVDLTCLIFCEFGSNLLKAFPTSSILLNLSLFLS